MIQLFKDTYEFHRTGWRSYPKSCSEGQGVLCEASGLQFSRTQALAIKKPRASQRRFAIKLVPLPADELSTQSQGHLAIQGLQPLKADFFSGLSLAFFPRAFLFSIVKKIATVNGLDQFCINCQFARIHAVCHSLNPSPLAKACSSRHLFAKSCFSSEIFHVSVQKASVRLKALYNFFSIPSFKIRATRFKRFFFVIFFFLIVFFQYNFSIMLKTIFVKDNFHSLGSLPHTV